MTDKDDLAQSRTDWAESRTDWAEDRTLLAAERTFAGWLRTGLTMIVVALGLQALFGPAEPSWLPKAVATGFLCAAAAAFWIGWRGAHRTRRNLDAHGCKAQSARSQTALTASLVLGVCAVAIVLWLL
ncbi:DUF202 domain-containing protein [Palleronia sediminis]|uniref:DUF202 domain-containing protein n=1 Tax=Palleronia sediminis TaxID=2547833 RepID=A0A4R6A0G3_9RHOB|nr:DUF202 domain-containing protein [Palleronia sediminis]TDL76034.1 DUF202 domain-containing protein [Palleronia sediminis]